MFRHMFCFGLIAASQLLGQPVLFQCPGAVVTVAEGINNGRTVVGYYSNQGGGTHGFVYSGTCTPFDVPGATTTVAMAINDSGTISGYYTDNTGFFHGFLRSAGGAITVLDYPTTTSNTLAFDINSAGTNVLVDGNGAVFLHSGTTYSQVILNHTYAFGFKLGITDSQNVIVGTAGASQNPGCFIDSYPSGTSTAFAVPGASSTYCFDINNAGSIAGAYYSSQGDEFAFVRVGSTVITLQGLPGAAAYGLNDMNQVVGSYATSTGQTAAFITSPTGSVPSDFNGDGVPDLVWQNDTTQQVTVWYMGGTGGAVFQGYHYLSAAGVPGWHVVAVADFNGDGVPDLVWQNDTTRQATVWYMGGTGGAVFQGWNYLSATGVPGWRIVAAADFNGDGVPDLVWQNDSTRQVTVWYMGGAGGAVLQGYAYLSVAGVPGWHVVAVADFNGDGVPDLVWQDDTSRKVTVWYMGGTGGASLQSYQYLDAVGHPGWFVAGATDLNRDGVPDLIWENDTTRQVTVWYMGGTGGATFQSYTYISLTGQPGWSIIHNPAFP